jgi:hypothetical protein
MTRPTKPKLHHGGHTSLSPFKQNALAYERITVSETERKLATAYVTKHCPDANNILTQLGLNHEIRQ